MLVRPAHVENSSSDFTLVGDESSSGFIPPANVTFSFVGRNDGAAAMVLRDPCGGGNPRVHLEDENGTTIATTEPTMRCMVAASFVAFSPGAEVSANWSWDGRVYDGSSMQTAAPGTYFAVGTFIAQRDGGDASLVVRVPVNVLSADNRGVL